MTRKKKIVLGVVAGALVLILTAGALLVSHIRASRPPEVATVNAVIGEVEQWLTLTGTVRSGEEKTYVGPTGVSIKEVFVKTGDLVKKGQLLATLDGSLYESTIEQAKNAYESAKSAYEQTLETKAEYASQRATLEREIAVLERETEKTEQENSADREKLEKLYEELRDKVESEENTEEALRAAMELLEQMINEQTEETGSVPQMELLTKQMQLYTLQLQETQVSDTVLENLKSAMDNAESTYSTVRQFADEIDAGLVAEFDGVVASVSTTASLLSSAGIVVKSQTGLYAEVSLGKYDIERVKEGQTARIEAIGGDFSGEVTHVSRVAESTISLTGTSSSNVYAQVRIDEGEDGSPLIDYECNVDILIAADEGTVVVPVESVRTDNAGSYCYKVSDGVVSRVAVTTGASSESLIAIYSGLAAGDELVYNPSGEIVDGQTITPKNVN